MKDVGHTAVDTAVVKVDLIQCGIVSTGKCGIIFGAVTKCAVGANDASDLAARGIVTEVIAHLVGLVKGKAIVFDRFVVLGGDADLFGNAVKITVGDDLDR